MKWGTTIYNNIKTRLLKLGLIIEIYSRQELLYVLYTYSPNIYLLHKTSDMFDIILKYSKVVATYIAKSRLIAFLHGNKFFWTSISRLFHIIINIILVILITNSVELNINMELWTNIADFISIKLGITKFHFTSCDGKEIIRLISHRWVYGLKSSIVLGLIYLVTISVSFIISNINYTILIVLALILTRAFLLNFFQKHFSCYALIILKFFRSGGTSKEKMRIWEIIARILLNIKPFLIFFFKSVITSILIVMFLRFNVNRLLMGGAVSDNFIINGLVLILPLPICSYFINLVLKKIKNQTINDEDYHLFNNYVVKSTNIYRIVYIFLIKYIVRNYYYLYVSVIGTIIIIVIILGLAYMYYNCKPTEGQYRQESTHLAAGGHVMATVSAFVALAPILQDGCNKGYSDYVNNRDRSDGQKYWKTLPFKEGAKNKYYMWGRTVNFLWERDRLMSIRESNADARRHSALFEDHKLRIEKSPILNMTYNIQHHNYVYNSKHKWEIEPKTFFSNDNFYGSVSETKLEKLLVVVLVRKDMNSSHFYPSYCLPDNTEEGQKRVIDMSSMLVGKYGINIPVGIECRAGYVIFTQGEPLNNNGLVRVWRPSLSYVEPKWLKHETKVSDYYKVYNSNLIRRETFNFKKAIDTIKRCAIKNGVDTVKNDYNQASTKELITNEVIADRICRKMYLNFILRGTEKCSTHGADVYNTDVDNWDDNSSDGNNEYLEYPDENAIDVSNTYDNDQNINDRVDSEVEGTNVDRESDKVILHEESASKMEGEYDPDKYETVEELMKDADIRRMKWNYELHQLKSSESEFEKNLRKAESLEESFWSNHLTPGTNSELVLSRRNAAIAYGTYLPKNGIWNFFSIARQGVIEGFKSQANALGRLNTEFQLPFRDNRKELLSAVGAKYTALDADTKSSIKTIHAISINRLTFEFIEVRPNNSLYYGYKEEDVVKEPKEDDFEIYSIFDANNKECIYNLKLENGHMDTVAPTHDYHFLDNKDEHSIRKLMDYVHKTEERGHLCYQSDIPNNEEALTAVDLSNRKGKIYLEDKKPSVKMEEFKVDKSSNKRMISRRDNYWPYKPIMVANLGVNPDIAEEEWEDKEFVDPFNSNKKEEFLNAFRRRPRPEAIEIRSSSPESAAGSLNVRSSDESARPAKRVRFADTEDKDIAVYEAGTENKNKWGFEYKYDPSMFYKPATVDDDYPVESVDIPGLTMEEIQEIDTHMKSLESSRYKERIVIVISDDSDESVIGDEPGELPGFTQNDILDLEANVNSLKDNLEIPDLAVEGGEDSPYDSENSPPMQSKINTNQEADIIEADGPIRPAGPSFEEELEVLQNRVYGLWTIDDEDLYSAD